MPAITKEIKAEIQRIVEDYNKAHKTKYIIVCKGTFAYVSKIDKGASTSFMAKMMEGMTLAEKKNFMLQIREGKIKVA